VVSSRLKKRFEELVSSGVRPLTSFGITPNVLTIFGLLVSVGAALCYIYWAVNPLLLPTAGGLILFSGFIDAIDGTLARLTGNVSRFGGLLDSISDRYSDAVVLSAVTYAGLCHPAWGLTAIVGSLLVSYVRARAEAAGVAMSSVGLAERAERMIFLSFATFTSYFRLELLSWGVVILAILSQFTVLQRIAYFYRVAAEG
jgi:archaetidylinositol phosphate synthase